MKRFSWKLGLAILPIVLLTPLLMMGLGCGGDDDNPGGPGDGAVPEAWVGKWFETLTMKDCETQDVLVSFSDTTTICPSEDDYQGIEDSVGVECDYSWSGDQMTVHCIYYDTLSGPCYTKRDVTTHTTVSGTSYSMTGTMELTYSGTSCQGESTCVDIMATGTRVGDAPDPCDPFAGGDGGGDLAGLSVDITGGGSTVQYEASDQATGVAYSGATQDYIVTTTMIDGGVTYTLNFFIPAAGGPDFELSTEPLEGKVAVSFSMMEGSDTHALVIIQQSALVLSEFTSERIVGTFSFIGGVQPLTGGDAETYTFANGTMELSVDVGPTKGLMTPAAVLKMIHNDIW